MADTVCLVSCFNNLTILTRNLVIMQRFSGYETHDTVLWNSPRKQQCHFIVHVALIVKFQTFFSIFLE